VGSRRRTALEALTPDVRAKDAALLPTRDAVAWKSDRRLSPAITADKVWKGENAPRGTAISWYLKSVGGPTTITISDAVTQETIRTQSVSSARASTGGSGISAARPLGRQPAAAGFP
jgi:hypothetical protein